MIRAPCGLSGPFFMISWLFINQSRQATYQIKAEYHSYSGLELSLLRIHKFLFITIFVLNVDISINIAYKFFKFAMLNLDIIMEIAIYSHLTFCATRRKITVDESGSIDNISGHYI